MTSKEALKELYSYSMLDDDIAKQNVEIIKKDLEVLDILKKNIFVADNMIYATSKELNTDDYNKLKEWYENDSNKNKSVDN